MSGKAISERWLAEKLVGITYDGSPVKFSRHPATSSTFPHITIATSGAVDLYEIGNKDAYERIQFTIRAWDEGQDATRVYAVAKEIHRRIHLVEPQAYEDGAMLSCHRVGALAFDVVEEQDGSLYIADGGLYEFHVVTHDE